MGHLDHLDHLLQATQVSQVIPACQVDQDLLERIVTLLDHLDSPDPADRTVNQASLDPKDHLVMKANPDRMDLRALLVILVRTVDLEKREPAAARMRRMDPMDIPDFPADPE